MVIIIIYYLDIYSCWHGTKYFLHELPHLIQLNLSPIKFTPLAVNLPLKQVLLLHLFHKWGSSFRKIKLPDVPQLEMETKQSTSKAGTLNHCQRQSSKTQEGRPH